MANKANGHDSISVKVAEKGGISIYGLGRFPITLYREQLEAILAKKDELQKFIRDNSGKLKTKAESAGPAGATKL